MKRLLRYARAWLRPEKPVPSVTVPAPAGPARIATPAEQKLVASANWLARAKREEREARTIHRKAIAALRAAEAVFDRARREVSQP
jgi:hypothetical protein